MNIVRLGFCALALTMSGISSVVGAAVIFVPSASDNGHYNTNPYDASSTKTVNGSGLSDTSVNTNGTTYTGTWPTNSNTNDSPGFNNGYAAAYNAGNVITYTLALLTDPAVNITGGHFWQYGGDTPSRSLQSAAIWVSSDGTSYSNVATLTPGYQEAAGTAGVAVQDPGVDFSLTSNGIRFIQLRSLVPVAGATGYVGFGEIRFVGSVPEPTSLGLFGLAGLGLLARRRRA